MAGRRKAASGLSPAIPDKSYFKIGEVAGIVGVKPSVLRFWETEFPTVRPEKSLTNQRLYSRRHVVRLVTIRELLYDQKFTIAGAKRRLRDPDAAPVEGDHAPEASTSPSGAGDLLGKIKREVEDL